MPLSIRTHRQGRVRHEISLYICILAQWKADYKEEVFAWHRKSENTGGETALPDHAGGLPDRNNGGGLYDGSGCQRKVPSLRQM